MEGRSGGAINGAHLAIIAGVFGTIGSLLAVVACKRSAYRLYDRVQHRWKHVFCQSASCQRIFLADNDHQCSYKLCLFGFGRLHGVWRICLVELVVWNFHGTSRLDVDL